MSLRMYFLVSVLYPIKCLHVYTAPFNPIEISLWLRCLHESISVRLSQKSDYLIACKRSCCGLGVRFYTFGSVFAWSTGFCRGLQEVHGTWSPGAPFHCGGSFQSINFLILPKRKTANHSEVLNTLNLYRFNFDWIKKVC